MKKYIILSFSILTAILLCNCSGGPNGDSSSGGIFSSDNKNKCEQAAESFNDIYEGYLLLGFAQLGELADFYMALAPLATLTSPDVDTKDIEELSTKLAPAREDPEGYALQLAEKCKKCYSKYSYEDIRDGLRKSYEDGEITREDQEEYVNLAHKFEKIAEMSTEEAANEFKQMSVRYIFASLNESSSDQ